MKTDTLRVANFGSTNAPVARHRILLVEDNPGDAMVISMMLSQSPSDDLEIVQVDRLETACHRIHDESFSVVLLDLGLPDSQGIETFVRMKEAARETPIIVLSDHSDVQVLVQAIREGAQDCLSKNIVSGGLLARSIRFAVERSKVLKQLVADSIRDKLTGLYNRRGFLNIAMPLLQASFKMGKTSSLFYADLDRLKLLNSTQGHLAGDNAVVAAAGILRSAFRESDTIARLGGDEFAAIAFGTDAYHQDAILMRIQEQVDQFNAMSDSGIELSLTVVAVDFKEVTHTSMERWLEDADRAIQLKKQTRMTEVAREF